MSGNPPYSADKRDLWHALVIGQKEDLVQRVVLGYPAPAHNWIPRNAQEETEKKGLSRMTGQKLFDGQEAPVQLIQENKIKISWRGKWQLGFNVTKRRFWKNPWMPILGKWPQKEKWRITELSHQNLHMFPFSLDKRKKGISGCANGHLHVMCLLWKYSNW